MIHVEYSTWHLNFEEKKGFAKNFGNFVVYFMTLSLYYVSLYCLWYELMLTFLFNFDHLANNLRIHNALVILNAYRLAQDFEEDSMMFSLIWWFEYPRNINKISKWDINLHVFQLLSMLVFVIYKKVCIILWNKI